MRSRNSEDSKVARLLSGAHTEGTLSSQGLQVLTAVDLGSSIQAGLGIAVDDVAASEVLLLTMMPDDSGSIRFAGHAQTVRDGHNLVLDTLLSSRQGDTVLAHTRYLNGTVLFPYLPIEQAVRMTDKNYDPSLGTPLYDQTAILLGSVLAKTQELAENGVAARSVTLILTDGADEGSRKASARDVASLVRDLIRAEVHIVAAMGIDGGHVDFRKVFRDMGIEDRWILTPGSDPAAIRKAFQVFSRSAVQASRSAAFAGTAMAGFLGGP